MTRSYEDKHVYAVNHGNEDRIIFKRFGKIISSFDHIVKLDKSTSIEKLLNDALSLIPEADKGTFFELDGSRYRPVAAIGYEMDTLSKLAFAEKDVLFEGFSPVHKEIEARQVDITTENQHRFDDVTKRLFKRLGTYDSFRVLYAPIWADGEIQGCLFLDNFSGIPYSSLSVKTLKYYAQLISSYYSQQIQQTKIAKMHIETVAALVSSIEVNDPYTEGHGKRVSYYAKEIAEMIGLPEERVRDVETAGLLHDIGKLGIPSEILNKGAKLTDGEYEMIKRHPENTHKILKNVGGLHRVREFTLCHHERFDGTGYPNGLIGDAIPFESQIISVADAFDAMTSDRAYRRAMPAGFALEVIKEQAGQQFHPDIVDIALDILQKSHERLGEQDGIE